MLRLVYVSTANPTLSDDDLLNILRVSRVNNARDGVTGLLLYKDGNIIQAIEGPAEKIEDLLDRLARDTRHRDIQVLSREQVEERLFPNWSMGFRRADDLAEADREHLSAFLEGGRLSLQRERRTRVQILLDTFREIVR